MKIIDWSDFEVNDFFELSSELQRRLIKPSLSKLSKLYLALKDDRNVVGYFILDYYPISIGLIIYELYIDEKNRNKKYGKEIIEIIRSIAKENSYTRVICYPHPIDGSSDKDEILKKETRLIKWYIQNGFYEIENNRFALDI